MAGLPGRPLLPLLTLALMAAAAAAAAAASAAASRPVTPRIRGFSLADVQLEAGSEFSDNFEQNSAYLLMLEPDNLLYNFRKTAGLPAPGESYGGWEWSDSEVRGQFIGHYLSAIAFAAQNTDRPEFRDRCTLMVRELKTVQDAFGNGFLAAFPESHFDRLEALEPVWVPYYVVHKVMAGLLDLHQLAEQEEALKMVTQMADYFCARVRRVLEVNGTAHWQQVLATEFGGMNEVLYNLYAVTQDRGHAECAHWFDKPAFYQPLIDGKDPLPGLHANTHLAQVQGFGARYEQLGDEEGMAAVTHFMQIMMQHHSFSTGGSNWYEHWGTEDSLGEAINNTDASALTEESCSQYNMLKLARYMFRHTGDPALADYYERAILNDVIGIQKKPAHDHSAHSHGSHSHSHNQQQQWGQGQGQGLLVLPPTASSAIATSSSHVHSNRRLAGPLPQEQEQEQWQGGAWQVEHKEEQQQMQQQRQQPNALGAAWVQPLITRPANYQVASWPSDPFAAARPNEQPGRPGVYIYFLPLGAGLTKGDKGHSWSHGWGDPTNTFWCCYGTAVESFAKLADSIYFKHMPDTAPSSTTAARSEGDGGGGVAFTGSSGSGGGGGVGLGAAAAAAAADLPQLFVNQLVSSRLRWRELGVSIRQEAELYGPDTAAKSRLTISIEEPQQGSGGGSSGSGGSSSGGSSSAGGNATQQFVLNWRIPGWAKGPEVELRVNGEPYSQCTEAAAAAEGHKNDGRPPPFGAGARFCSLGSTWRHGDVVEAVMPMRVVAEDLNDGRKELQALKAIMTGPLLMAGLTHDDNRDLVADPARIEQAISPPDDNGAFVSIALAAPAAAGAPAGAGTAAAGGSVPLPPPPPLLRHCRGGAVVLGSSSSSSSSGVGCGGGSGSALDATFKLVAPLAGCAPSAPTAAAAAATPAAAGAVACDPATARLLLMPGAAVPTAAAGGGVPGGAPLLVSFEAASLPGYYLTADAASGTLLLQQQQQGRQQQQQQGRQQQQQQEASTHSLAPHPAAGTAGTAGTAATAQTFLVHVGGPLEADGQLRFTLEPLSQPGSRAALAGDKQQLLLQTVTNASEGSQLPASFSLAAPAAPAYPPGARLLHGRNRDYLLVPIGQVMEETYTAYFRFIEEEEEEEEESVPASVA